MITNKTGRILIGTKSEESLDNVDAVDDKGVNVRDKRGDNMPGVRVVSMAMRRIRCVADTFDQCAILGRGRRDVYFVYLEGGGFEAVQCDIHLMFYLAL